MAKELFLGEDVDPAKHERTGEALIYDPADLTTHGVIVGMTGSGKTGLGVVLLEEALRNGIPTLILDPKGDMTNMALRFPGLSTEEFAPWVQGDADAAATATTWKDGLASWGLDGSHIQGLADNSRVTIYTPGSSAGVPLNMIGSLAAPATKDAEAMNDEIEGIVSALLSMVGIEADPLASREHILMSNLVSRAWTEGTNLDLGVLVQQIQDPPIRKLGVLEIDSFYPADERTKLALKLNGLLASPSFAAWAEGVPLDIGAMLSPQGPDGAGGPACSVVYLAHLSDEERQFVVTLLLSKVVTWMRSQSGTPDLRALIYMDEVFGYVPPSAAPPAKKPILTILKQARAFGVGMVLSTQNPVDLDYKAISNAGTWMIGRLQTERDVSRLSEGLANSSGNVDLAAITGTIAGLGKREFVLHTTKGKAPRTFTTRWTLDYLAGPLTKEQLSGLPGQPDATTVTAASASSAASTVPAAERTVVVADDEVSAAPEVADGTPVRWVDPAAPWLPEVGGDPASTSYQAGIAARVQLLFDETAGDLRETQEFECVVVGLPEVFDAEAIVAVDYDDRDLRDVAPAQIAYKLSDAPIKKAAYFTEVEKAIKDRLFRDQTLTLHANATLKLTSRPGETAEAFAARCDIAADGAADAEVAKIRTRLETKMGTIRSAIEREEIRMAELKDKESDSKQHEVLSAAGDILGSLLGGRKSTRSILSKVKGVSSRRKQSSAAGGRVEAAVAKVEQKQLELGDLEAELADAMADIQADWDAKAAEVTEVAVGLEKTDISITQLALIWLPV